MTAMDYYTLNLELINQYNDFFEYWLSITFAFVMASYFAASRIGNKFQYLLASLYAVTSFLFIIRFALRALSVSNLHETMIENGIPVAPWSGQIFISGLVAPGMFWVMVIGTIAAIFFSLSKLRAIKDT